MSPFRRLIVRLLDRLLGRRPLHDPHNRIVIDHEVQAEIVGSTLVVDPKTAAIIERLAELHRLSPDEMANLLARNMTADRWQQQRVQEAWEGLSPRQQQVTALTCLSYTNGQMALLMGVTIHTIRAHHREIFYKLDLHSKIELGRFFWDWDFSEWEKVDWSSYDPELDEAG